VRRLVPIIVLLATIQMMWGEPTFQAELLPNTIRITISEAGGMEVQETHRIPPVEIYVRAVNEKGWHRIMSNNLANLLVLRRGLTFRDAIPGITVYEYSIKYQELWDSGIYDKIGGELMKSNTTKPLTSEEWRSLISSGKLRLIWLARPSGDTTVSKAELKQQGEQAGAVQPATRPESNSEGSDKPQPEAEGRSR
jgi:hypothetical protein